MEQISSSFSAFLTKDRYMLLRNKHIYCGSYSHHFNMSLVVRKPVFGVSDQVRHKPGCTARGLEFWIYEGEGLYYPCSENKGADQLHSYREADLRLCFRICKKPVFSRRGSYDHSCRLRSLIMSHTMTNLKYGIGIHPV